MKTNPKIPAQNDSSEKLAYHYYKKQIKASMILYVEMESVFLFEMAKKLYITNPEGFSLYFRFEKGSATPFVKTDEFSGSSNFQEAILQAYYSRVENWDSVDYEEYLACYDGLEEMDFTLSKKQRRFVMLIRAIANGQASLELEELKGNSNKSEGMAVKLIDELANEFLFSSDEMISVLNRTTGEILLDAPASLTGEPELDWNDESSEDLIQIPQITSSEAFEVRLLFAKQQKPGVKELLLDALQGKKPFKKFRSQVEKLDLDQSWYDFEFQYAKDQITAWLDKWNQ